LGRNQAGGRRQRAAQAAASVSPRASQRERQHRFAPRRLLLVGLGGARAHLALQRLAAHGELGVVALRLGLERRASTVQVGGARVQPALGLRQLRFPVAQLLGGVHLDGRLPLAQRLLAGGELRGAALQLGALGRQRGVGGRRGLHVARQPLAQAGGVALAGPQLLAQRRQRALVGLRLGQARRQPVLLLRGRRLPGAHALLVARHHLLKGVAQLRALALEGGALRLQRLGVGRRLPLPRGARGVQRRALALALARQRVRLRLQLVHLQAQRVDLRLPGGDRLGGAALDFAVLARGGGLLAGQRLHLGRRRARLGAQALQALAQRGLVGRRLRQLVDRLAGGGVHLGQLPGGARGVAADRLLAHVELRLAGGHLGLAALQLVLPLLPLRLQQAPLLRERRRLLAVQPQQGVGLGARLLRGVRRRVRGGLALLEQPLAGVQLRAARVQGAALADLRAWRRRRVGRRGSSVRVREGGAAGCGPRDGSEATQAVAGSRRRCVRGETKGHKRARAFLSAACTSASRRSRSTS
jgi:hypothetical protein